MALRLQMPATIDTLGLEMYNHRGGTAYMGIARSAVGASRCLASLSDEELAARCRRKDHAAFTEIVDRYKHRIHWLVRRMVGSRDDEDITQEVFIRAYEAIPRLRNTGTFRAWLYKIAHNLCLNELKKRGRRGEHISLEGEGEERVHWQLRAGREDLEAHIEKMDISESVRCLVGRLPVQYRTVLTLFYLHHVHYEEIAAILDIPLGTVKTHIHRARLRLRDLILAESDLAGLVGEARSDKPEHGGDA